MTILKGVCAFALMVLAMWGAGVPVGLAAASKAEEASGVQS